MAPSRGFEPGEIARAMKDPAREYLTSLSASGATPAQIIERLFSEGKIFTRELNSLQELKTETTNLLEKIITVGVEATTKALISS